MHNIDNTLDATITVLLIIPISSTCFGQLFCPKHVELIGIINKTVIVATSWLSILFISMLYGQANIKLTHIHCRHMLQLKITHS